MVSTAATSSRIIHIHIPFGPDFSIARCVSLSSYQLWCNVPKCNYSPASRKPAKDHKHITIKLLLHGQGGCAHLFDQHLQGQCYYPSVQCQSFASEARAIVGWSAPLGCARASLQRPSPLFLHLGTWCVLHSSTSVHIHCSLSIVPFLIVFCLVVSFACVCVCLETTYCPYSVYNLQVERTNTLVSFPHLQVSSLFSPHWIQSHSPTCSPLGALSLKGPFRRVF